ncbi:MAG: bifunctional diaminohydroxyphosphoribosylaminopyrimidine deaminase/5-amino-6-(5-phosphoribosylamino)uracil reductase RibD [Eggerthellaceae bacterium]
MAATTDDFDIIAGQVYMRRAIELARTAHGWVNPNPMVGAVVVKDGCVIGEGCHERYGDLHAERNALAACSESPEGATIFVTLEPCSHFGSQPPCADALIEAGIARVVVGSRDPNPLVSGKGNARLREAGIEVIEDFLRDECDRLNAVFFHFITTNTPYVIAKWAMTADGRIAAHTGDSRWVSNELSRTQVHEMRHDCMAIMVGIGTVLADDPLLTARRDEPSRQPLRVVCDSMLSIPLHSQLVQSAAECGLLVATAADLEGEAASKVEALFEAGAEVVSLPDGKGRVDLPALMRELGARKIDSVLLEGGSTLNWAAFSQGLVSEAVVYLAPKVVGGSSSPAPVGGAGFDLMSQAAVLGSPAVELVGDDVKITYKMDGGASCSRV